MHLKKIDERLDGENLKSEKRDSKNEGEKKERRSKSEEKRQRGEW